MTYELAKELKDAGFPQKKHEDEVCTASQGLGCHCQPYEPTLSELIEACGEIKLNRHYHGDQFLYEAKAIDKNGTLHIFITSSGEESTAKVWLALNKKS